MIRTMSSARLNLAGRVTAWFTMILCVVVVVVIGAMVVQEMHPPRVTGHAPKTSAFSPLPKHSELGLDSDRVGDRLQRLS
jgi:hypothetical protein